MASTKCDNQSPICSTRPTPCLAPGAAPQNHDAPGSWQEGRTTYPKTPTQNSRQPTGIIRHLACTSVVHASCRSTIVITGLMTSYHQHHYRCWLAMLVRLFVRPFVWPVRSAPAVRLATATAFHAIQHAVSRRATRSSNTPPACPPVRHKDRPTIRLTEAHRRHDDVRYGCSVHVQDVQPENNSDEVDDAHAMAEQPAAMPCSNTTIQPPDQLFADLRNRSRTEQNEIDDQRSSTIKIPGAARAR